MSAVNGGHGDCVRVGAMVGRDWTCDDALPVMISVPGFFQSDTDDNGLNVHVGHR